MMGTRLCSCIVVAVVSACQSTPPPRSEPKGASSAHSATASSAHSAPSPASCKPEAPIAIDVSTRAIDDGIEVVTEVVPAKLVDDLDVRLVLPSHATALGATSMRFGATAAGQTRRLVTRVRVDGRTSSITVVARVPIAGVDMSRTATVAIGTPVPAPVTRTYVVDGDLVREVRP